MSDRRFATWNPQTKQYEAPGRPCDAYESPPGGGYHCYRCGHEWRKHSKEAQRVASDATSSGATDLENGLLGAAADFLAEHNIEVAIIGGISVRQQPDERQYNHELIIKFTGKLPGEEARHVTD